VQRGSGDDRRSTKAVLPESYAETWEPLVLPQGRCGILSDVHVPYHDRTAVEAAVKYLRRRKLDGIVLNGDIGDFYSVSRFLKDPKARSLRNEIQDQRDFLAWLRSQFRGAHIIFKRGNHEERWDAYIQGTDPRLWDLEELSFGNLLQLDAHGIDLAGRRQNILAGHLNILHGHELEQGASSPVNPARGAFLRTKECVAIGHRHQTSEHSEPTLSRKVIATWSMGCLCGLWPDYAVTNRWNHGFGFVEVGPRRAFSFENHKIINGVVY
jgi:predicted phosphodiesterase